MNPMRRPLVTAAFATLVGCASPRPAKDAAPAAPQGGPASANPGYAAPPPAAAAAPVDPAQATEPSSKAADAAPQPAPPRLPVPESSRPSSEGKREAARSSADEAGSGGGGRAASLRAAASELSRGQRELDAAAGDCAGACRALGSMDRAAGRLCSLAVDEPERRRCADATRTLQTARDRVKATCGACPDVSVDRRAPVPSGR